MRAYAQSAGYAEQALSAIRVVHSYGQEELEYKNYAKYLQRAKDVQRKLAVSSSLGLSVIFGVIISVYAYNFYWGAYLKWEEVKNGDKEYTGGQILGIMICVITGAF